MSDEKEEKKEGEEGKKEEGAKSGGFESHLPFVADESPIKKMIELMIEKETDVVLVHDMKLKVVGIVTEQDILRKFTLLDMADKLDKMVSTVMTRPVMFVSEAKKEKEILKLYKEKGIRHFPVLKDKESTADNVSEIVSISDFLDMQLDKGKKSEGDGAAGGDSGGANGRPIGLLGRVNETLASYSKTFSGMGYKVIPIDNFDTFVKEFPQHDCAVLFDADGYPKGDMQDLLTKTRLYRGPMILAASNPSLVQGLRKFLNQEHQFMALKPVDTDFCHWLLTHKWANKD